MSEGDFLERHQLERILDHLAQTIPALPVPYPFEGFLKLVESIVLSIHKTKTTVVQFSKKQPQDTMKEPSSILKQSSPYMTTKEAADYLKISQRQLLRLRQSGEGPEWNLPGGGDPKQGKKVLYHKEKLDVWIETRKRQ